MGVSGKVTGRAWTVPKGLAFGVGISMLVTLVISAIFAHMVSSEWIPQQQIGYCAIAALLTASGTGAWIAAGKIKIKPIQIAAFNGILYFAVLLALTAVFFGGQYDGMGVTLTVIALGSMTGGILARRGAQAGYKKRRKKPYR